MNPVIEGSPEPWLTGREAASLLGVTKATLTMWVKGGCPHLTLSQAYRFRASEVEAWLKTRHESQAAAAKEVR